MAGEKSFGTCFGGVDAETQSRIERSIIEAAMEGMPWRDHLAEPGMSEEDAWTTLMTGRAQRGYSLSETGTVPEQRTPEDGQMVGHEVLQLVA